ncbi:family 10 glycosylhydrolase [Bacillus sp. FJAT-28004]|uniref:family 10 glycosylhydrolase n=1 Tax=Bacillus sp. FJAT-28004 TaxID=1679165 RepID=UPI0006B488B4|nr:family 10 glycosylhydrolase [Bacillus sp. FJAT-28004]
MIKTKGLQLLVIVLFFGILFPTHSSGVQASQAPFGTEIIVRTVNQFRNITDVTAFIQKAVQYNVDIISMNVKQDEDDEVPSGHVFYDSAIAPIAAGYENFDALQHVITQAHQNGIEVRAWIPQFHDQAAFLEDPSWQMHALVDGIVVPFTGSNGNEYFVNPIHPDVQAYQRSIIEEVVSNYDIDGVVLDWLRFDNYNMDVSSYTVNLYESIYGYSPLDIDFAADSTRRNEWNEWRTDQIGGYVQDVRDDIDQIKAGMELGVYILPPEFTEVGQNVAKFKDAIDFVAPMAYFDDWEFDTEWVYGANGILSDTSSLAGPGVTIVPTLDNDWTANEYQEVYGGIRNHFPQVTHLSFFSYGAWDETVLSDINTRRTWPAAQDYEANIPTEWKARNIGLKPGSANYSGGAFTLSGTNSDIWGNEDQLNYIYQSLQGDGSIVARVTGMNNMDGWAKAGVMIRESLAVDAKHADMIVTPANGAAFQYRAANQGNTVDHTIVETPPSWLMLERSGNLFTGSISTDGENWTAVSSASIAMGSNVYIGLALSNSGSATNSQAIIDHVSLSGDLPVLWKTTDINSTTGAALYQSGTYTLSSRDSDIWGATDKMRYAYLPLTGNGSIIAKVSNMTNMNGWAKAGVMIRETLGANAKHVDMLITPSNGASFQYRQATGGITMDTVTAVSLPRWVKLERINNQFIGYISSNGVSWTEVGRRTLTMNSGAYIGLALSNPGSSTTNQVLFNQVQIVR